MLVDEDGALAFSYPVMGFVCEKCGEELIDRQTAIEIQNSQTPVIVWRPLQTATTTLTSDLISASRSTADALVPA
jgi:hypothetical protein